LRFVLFPMVHLGTPAFYEEVERRLKSCHVVVAEGVSGRPPIGLSALTASYRLPGRRGRDGMTTQGLDLSRLHAQVVNPDMTSEEFMGVWRKVPLVVRGAAMVLAPLFGVWTALFGSRELFAKYLEVDDLPTREEMAVMSGRWERLEDLVVADRDARLVACLD